MLFLHNNFYIDLVRNMLCYSQFWIYFLNFMIWSYTCVAVFGFLVICMLYILGTCFITYVHFKCFRDRGLDFIYLFKVFFLYRHFKVSYMHIIQYFIKKCFLYLRKSSLLQRKRVNGLRFFLDGLESFSWFIGRWSDWNLFSERHMTEI